MSAKGERVLEGGGLRVRFFWRADRFAHEVGLLDGAQWTPLLRSIEGTCEDHWPPSPPLQSIELPPARIDQQLAFLVGMAGKSHWSASVELDPRAGSVRFNMACRLRGAEAANSLRSSYEVLGRSSAVEAQQMLVFPARALGAGPGLQIDAASAVLRRVASAQRLQIEPQWQPCAGAAQTVAWRYAIAAARS